MIDNFKNRKGVMEEKKEERKKRKRPVIVSGFWGLYPEYPKDYKDPYPLTPIQKVLMFVTAIIYLAVMGWGLYSICSQ